MTNEIDQYPAEVLQAARNAIDCALAAKVTEDGNGKGSGAPSIVEVATCLLYLATGPVKVLGSTRTVGSTSYGWKHEVEHWGRRVGLAPYVSNGAFIAAADYYGVPCKRPRGLNVVYALKLLRTWHDDSERMAKMIFEPSEQDALKKRHALVTEVWAGAK